MNASTFFFLYRRTLAMMCLLSICLVVFPDPIAHNNESASIAVKPVKARTRKRSHKKIKKARHYVADMNNQELQAAQQQAIEKGNLEFAIKCTEQLIKLCTNSHQLPDLMICLANLYFESGNYETAARLYTEFTAMYPGRSELEFAAYRAIVAQFNLTLDPDRDQTNTQTTIALADQFLERGAIFIQYPTEVAAIRTKCYEKEAESEVRICSFYINQGNVKAAQNRITSLREHFLTQLPTLENTIVALESRVAVKQDPQATLQSTLTLKPEVTNEKSGANQKNTAHTMKNRF